MSDTSDDNQSFQVADFFKDAPLDDDSKARDERRAKKREKKTMTSEEKEEQRKINRENREKKKLLKEKNKKRKRGEEVSSDEEEEEQVGKDGPNNKKPKSDKKQRQENEHGVWVGNLNFRTGRDTIEQFFADCGNITRINIRKGRSGNEQNRGFVYVMFEEEEAVAKAIGKSEQRLDGRSLLIKSASDYQRKDGLNKKEIKKHKNPPCPTLFIGNLPFTATKESLQEVFEWAGPIRSVRLGTFEDSGKCKGFGYVDFETVEDATKAIRAPDKHELDDRKIRVEFATEDAHKRSMPWLIRRERAQQKDHQQPGRQQATTEHTPASSEEPSPAPRPRREKREKKEDKPKKPRGERLKPGEALSNAPRQRPTVQDFKGTKITFD
ncbi:RNA-binding domain-containing protein [Hesseltinella vesiculosa]|uniref:RNA-binding domain-containing protein n=1 Tax=Hesseltinella vesiculosa TaxID=101127 RepID=A0A1X2GTM1_9FUNG|nr:RNA-binding domain-containing protein [Hesseltinella vesiculosa]